jgi:hypothetical protein
MIKEKSTLQSKLQQLTSTHCENNIIIFSFCVLLRSCLTHPENGYLSAITTTAASTTSEKKEWWRWISK